MSERLSHLDMIERCPVHRAAGRGAVLIFFRGHDNPFKGKVVFTEESSVAGQILAYDDCLGVGDENQDTTR